jgi:membrane-bound lytic murein transglycosylase D
MEWNQLTSTKISVGQMLKIQTKITTTVENPEYLQQQQELQEDESDTLQETQQIQQAPVVKTQPKPEVRKKYYSVRNGDTFSNIASRHGLTVTQLKRLNPGVNVSRIQPGQKIRIK